MDKVSLERFKENISYLENNNISKGNLHAFLSAAFHGVDLQEEDEKIILDSVKEVFEKSII